jgi:hypothetical protein
MRKFVRSKNGKMTPKTITVVNASRTSHNVAVFDEQ